MMVILIILVMMLFGSFGTLYVFFSMLTRYQQENEKLKKALKIYEENA